MPSDYAGALNASSDSGTLVAAVRKDSATALASADGKFAPLQVDSDGALRVNASITLSASDIQIGAVEIKNGADDTRAEVSVANALKVDGSAVTQPVSLASVPSHAVTNAGTFAVQESGAALTALQLIDDTVYASDAAIGKVIGIGGQFDDTTPGTTTENSVRSLRMSTRRELYTQIRDAAGNERGTNVNASGQLTVSVDSITSLAAGTNNIGDVDILSIAAGDNNIGNVDLASSIPAGTNNIGDVDILSVIPGTGATNLGKAIDTATGATDTGVLALATRDDALSALTPIEGDNIQLRVDANGALWTHDDALDAALAGSELQVDVVAALPAGTNAIGKLAANSGVDIGDVDVTSIAAGDNNIGNVDIVSGTITTVSALGTGTTGPMKAEDVAHSTGDMGIPAWGVRQDSPNATFAASNDYHMLTTDMVGGIRTALYETDFAVLGTKHVKKYYTNAGAVTDGIIWSPAAGARWYVTDIFINVSAAATVTLEDDLGAGDSAIWKAELAANSGWSHSFNTPWFSGEDAADLIITTSAGNVYCTVTGYEI